MNAVSPQLLLLLYVVNSYESRTPGAYTVTYGVLPYSYSVGKSLKIILMEDV